ncbi:TPA: hypothetical protein ACH3X2_008060 [Trebouxia sp. C0005]
MRIGIATAVNLFSLLSLQLICQLGQPVLCKRQGAPQRQLHPQQYSSHSLDPQEAAALDSSAQLRPGYKWDQFLLIPDTPPAESGLKAFLNKLLPSWLLSTKPTPPALSQPQPLDSDGSEPVAVDNATWVPVLPAAIAWMMHDAEDRISESGIKLSKAQLLAKLTSVSYCQRNNIKAWNCSRCTQSDSLRRFNITTTVYDIRWDLFAFAGYSTASELGGGAIVVAFRGTDSHSLYNWVENMRYWKTDYDIPYPGSEGALVHTGFFMSYNASDLAPNITTAVRALQEEYPHAPLYVAGHSMGAAMAHICAMDLKFTLGFDDVNVYTYGSPRVGNTIFKDFFNKIVNESVRVTHNRDIVPSVPPQYVGFHHVAREVWQLDGEKYFGTKVYLPWVCDGSGEDPVCHNSVCFLGLCTSITDHMQYMGAHMYHRNSNPC